MLLMNGTGVVMEFLQSPMGLFLVTVTGFALIAAPEVIDRIRALGTRSSKKKN